MKKIGPALAGDTMRRPMGWSKGAVPRPARGTQLEAMKPNSISSRSSRLALSMLAELRVSSQRSSGGRDALKTWAMAAPLGVEGAARVRGADPENHMNLRDLVFPCPAFRAL